jgi:two-component system cell cycle sensor histidine kinase/response regulator CckA
VSKSPPVPEYQRLFESSPSLWLALLPNDPVFTIVGATDAYLAATMTERGQILNRGIFEIFPDNPDDAGATGVRNLHASLRTVLHTRAADTMAVQKYDIRRPESEGGGFEERFWSPLNVPVFDDDRNVRWIIHRVEDVTEFIRLKEKEAEQARFTERLLLRTEQMESEVFLRAQEVQDANRRLHRANEQLARLREHDSMLARTAIERSERRYRTLVSASSSIVWTRNPAGFFAEPQLSWNAFTGQNDEQSSGWGWLDAIHPADRDRVREHWARIIVTGATSDLEARIWKAETNSWCHFSERAVAVTSPDGSVQEWIGAITDIDERRRLEGQLRHTAKLESLGILAGGIAHDFNNLLSGILGNASQALEVMTPRNPADRAILVDIVAAAERAAHLTRQMLAYSGKGAFEVRDIDLSELVRGISALVQSSVPRNVHLRLELGDRLPFIEADPGQIQQVVMNLIINGAEAIPEGANGSVVVSTTVQHVDEGYAANFDTTYSLKQGVYVSLEVHDNGSGMTEEVKRKIFDPFFTTKVHGRGLGLSAVLGIVRGHRGALRVYSQTGDGTTFKVLFPAKERGADFAPAADNVSLTSKAGLVLVIDDEDLVCNAMKSILERRGFAVAVANDGVAGVQRFRDNPAEIALVILDLTMPKQSGEETLRQLRAIRQDIPVILSSGYSEVEATRRFVGKGLASFLQKPFTMVQLLGAVEAALAEPSGSE